MNEHRVVYIDLKIFGNRITISIHVYMYTIYKSQESSIEKSISLSVFLLHMQINTFPKDYLKSPREKIIYIYMEIFYI